MAARNEVIALDVEQAQIATATVTIKALKVNSRQLTQAVFRQLPERRLVDGEGARLLGLPWGWVNYQTGDMRPGRQFVAQFGGDLCRCPFPMRKSDSFFQPYSRFLDDDAPPGFREIWRDYDWACENASLALVAAGCVRPSENPGDSRTKIAIASRNPFPAFVFRQGHDWPWNYRETEDIELAVKPRRAMSGGVEIAAEESGVLARGRLRDLLGERGEHDSDPAVFLAELEAIAERARDFNRRWDELIDRLATVEQLYIAT